MLFVLVFSRWGLNGVSFYSNFSGSGQDQIPFSTDKEVLGEGDDAKLAGLSWINIERAHLIKLY